MRTALLLAVAFTAGCHYDLDAVDRPGGDGGGANADAAANDGAVADPCGEGSVPAAVHLHGAVLDAADSSPVVNVLVDAIPGGNALSASDGSFAIDVALGGVARSIALSFDPPDDGIYPLHGRAFQRPFDRADVDVQPRLHSFAQLDTTTLYDYMTNPHRDPEAVTVVLWVFDCEDNGVSGATVSVDPPADAIVYYMNDGSTNATGVAYALNVPPGTMTASATGAEDFTFEAAAGSVVIAQLLAP